jgi:uncharacterized protein
LTRGRRGAVAVLALVGLAYGGVCGLMFMGQRSLLYFPTQARELAGAQRLTVASGGETLRVWARPAQGPAALIYFGGNGEDVAGRLDEFAAALPGHSLYLVNYRGYGGSSGSPTEAGLFADALAVYDQVRAKHRSIAVAGRSLGSGVAVYLAQQRPVARLVLITPYDSVENVAKGRYPFLPVAWLLRDKFDSVSRIAQVKAPTLVVIAGRDQVILRERTDALVARIPAGLARVEVVSGATHNALDYVALMGEFLAP